MRSMILTILTAVGQKVFPLTDLYYRVHGMTNTHIINSKKWLMWSVLRIFFRRKGTKPILQVTVYTFRPPVIATSPSRSILNGYSHLQNRLRPLSPKKILSTDHLIHFWRWRRSSVVYSEVPRQPPLKVAI